MNDLSEFTSKKEWDSFSELENSIDEYNKRTGLCISIGNSTTIPTGYKRPKNAPKSNKIAGLLQYTSLRYVCEFGKRRSDTEINDREKTKSIKTKKIGCAFELIFKCNKSSLFLKSRKVHLDHAAVTLKQAKIVNDIKDKLEFRSELNVSSRKIGILIDEKHDVFLPRKK
eukprot:GAHX01005856.1.p1 GENE.GAHX01005856.1~~GAHX01005856.1.p1  ORF type:complete len:170 (-),score=19.43 GAHX01005856.1:75-584(-)